MRDYAEQIDSIRRCAESDDPVYECCFEDCNQHHGRRDNMCRQKIMMDAADAIEELLAAVPKWNPASKPPKEKGDYWCNVRSYNFDDTYYQHEVWFDGECFVIDGVCTDRVTHWMPLPEAPKEERTDDDA